SPAVCVVGAPLLPLAVPGAALSPGASNCSFSNAPAVTLMAGLVLLGIPAWVASAAATVAVPAVLSVRLKLAVPATSGALAGNAALVSLELMATVSLVLITFQLASTALTVTLN